MNQSKAKELFVRFGLPILICALTMAFSYPFRLSWDAIEIYAPKIDAGYIGDWHSDLFIGECILLKYFVGSLFSECANGIDCVQIASWCSFFIIAIIFSTWVWRLSPNIYFVVTILIFFNIALNFCFRCYAVGLDPICIAPIFMALEFAYRIKYSESALSKYISFFLLLVAIIHLLSFRKNSLVAILPMLYWLIPLQGQRFLRISKGAITLGGALLLYFISTTGVASLLRSEKEYPLIPILASHICTTQALCNEKLDGKLWEPCNFQTVAYQNLYFSKSEYHNGHYHQPSKEIYHELKDSCIAVTWAHPKESLTTKLLHALFFYTDNRCPRCIASYMAQKYPHIPLTGQAFFAQGNAIILFRAFGLLVPLSVAFLCYFKRKQRGAFAKSYDFLFVISSFAMAYALSFAIVTPTPNGRYCLPPFLLSTVLISIGCLTLYKEKIGNPYRKIN